MNTALSILCIALGVVGIFSITFSLFADKRRKEKLKKMKDVIQRKVKTIDSLQQENAFLRYAVEQHKEWFDELIES